MFVNQKDETRWQFVINAVLPERSTPKLSIIIKILLEIDNSYS